VQTRAVRAPLRAGDPPPPPAAHALATPLSPTGRVAAQRCASTSASKEKRRDRADIVAARQREAQALAGLQIERARIDAQRRRAEADVGPVRYLAELIGTPATDLATSPPAHSGACRRARSVGGSAAARRRHTQEACRLTLTICRDGLSKTRRSAETLRRSSGLGTLRPRNAADALFGASIISRTLRVVS
jgi:hypothetical protein